MKNLILIILMSNFASSNGIKFEKTEFLRPKQQLVITKNSTPISLEIKNKSNTNLLLISNLKMQKEILPNQVFEYRLPKKGTLRIHNPSTQMVEINLKYESLKKINYQIK